MEYLLPIQQPPYAAAAGRIISGARPVREDPRPVALITEDDLLQTAVCIAMQTIGPQPRRFLTPWQFEQYSTEETPQILLLDQQQTLDCNDAFTAKCLLQSKQTRLILLAEMPTTRSIVAAMKAGATTVLEKPVTVETLRAAILDAGWSRAGEARSQPGQEASGCSGILLTLTQQQQRVASLVYVGKSNRQIADLLSISVKTVESHRTQIMNRLKVGSVAALIRLMIRESETTSAAAEQQFAMRRG